jgi:hypothetical protein
VIPSKYFWNKQRKIWRGGSRGHFKIFKHLWNSGGKNPLVTYRLITLKNNSKQVFNRVWNSESTSWCICYMHWLSCMCHCFHHAVKNLLHWSTLWSCLAFFLKDPCSVCDSLSSQWIWFIWANNKMNYLFSGHDPGLLEEGPSLRKKAILKPVVPNWGKRRPLLGRGFFFLAWFIKICSLIFWWWEAATTWEHTIKGSP